MGIWRYRNTSASDVVLDIDIQGVDDSRSVVALFSNGASSAADRVPGWAAAAIAPAPQPGASLLAARLGRGEALLDRLSRASRRHDASHLVMLRQNLDIARKLLKFKASMKQFHAEGAPLPAAPPPAPTPAVGTTRTWNDNFGAAPVPYQLTVEKSCALPGGRNAVFWVDPNAKPLLATVDPMTNQPTDALAAFVTAFCGPAGGYAKLVDLMGEPWGPAASNYPGMLHEMPNARQDVHIVIPNVSSSTGWGGYFSYVNNYSKKTYPQSNEAIAFFANPTSINENLPYMISTLIHETTHMINFYQRTVARGQSHGAWLEETSAMMSEDVVAPGVQPPPHYNSIESERIPGYVGTGGAVSYIRWPQLSLPNYDLGGSFGAFLDRRFGVPVFSRLVDSCTDSDDLTSYRCLDQVLKGQGSVGLDDEFARFGASIFAGLGGTDVPDGFGYPQRQSGTYALAAIDLGPAMVSRPVPATTLLAGFPATAQTYYVDVQPPGSRAYQRSGVVVPAKSDLVVVIK